MQYLIKCQWSFNISYNDKLNIYIIVADVNDSNRNYYSLSSSSKNGFTSEEDALDFIYDFVEVNEITDYIINGEEKKDIIIPIKKYKKYKKSLSILIDILGIIGAIIIIKIIGIVGYIGLVLFIAWMIQGYKK